MSYFLNFLIMAVTASVPLLLGTLGEMLTEKSGTLNLGLEGLVFLGGIGGFATLYCLQPTTSGTIILWSLLGSLGTTCLAALFFAFLTVTLKANQNIAGLALTITGTGLANFVGEYLVSLSASGYAVIEPIQVFNTALPCFQTLAKTGWLGKLLFSYNFLVYLAIILVLIWGCLFYHTSTGLNLRAVGENPAAADACGIRVSWYRYWAIIIGGGISGLAGLYLVLNSSFGCGGVWIFNGLSGYGWLSLALVIFSRWNPYKALYCSLFFGGLSILRFYYPLSFIPAEFYSILPYLATIIALILLSFRSFQDSSPFLGKSYFRESR